MESCPGEESGEDAVIGDGGPQRWRHLLLRSASGRARLGLTRYSQPLPLAGFQTSGDTLRAGRRRIYETTIERQDASAIHRLTARRSCEDDRDGAHTREQAHSARLR